MSGYLSQMVSLLPHEKLAGGKDRPPCKIGEEFFHNIVPIDSEKEVMIRPSLQVLDLELQQR